MGYSVEIVTYNRGVRLAGMLFIVLR